MRFVLMLSTTVLACAFCPPGRANPSSPTLTYSVTVNTAPLVGHAAGPFSILFAFTDGSGASDTNNAVTVSNVNFGGGSASGVPVLFGGAAGSLETSVSMTDSSLLNLFSEAFLPGNILRFTVSLTTTDDDGEIPDRLTFFILDSSGARIPTLSPAADFLFGIDLGSTGASPEVFGTDPSRSPSTGNPITINPPMVTLLDTTPPVTTTLLSAQPNAAGWNNTNVTVTLNSTDNEPGGTGVKQIQWLLTGAQTGSSTVAGNTTAVTIFTEGTTTLIYFGTDNAGNQEVPKTLTVQLDKSPPVITASANPATLWPPNGKLLTVTVSGAMSDILSGINRSTAAFAVQDSFGLVQPSGPVSVARDGTYSFTISLEARRDGQDRNGRLYTIVVSAQDNAGNPSSATTTVIVPHDQGN